MERQRKKKQGVSQTSKTPAPSTARAETFLEPKTLSHRETFFLFHRARRIFFLMSQKENGGVHSAGKAGVVPRPAPVARKNPRAGTGAKSPAPDGAAIKKEASP
jgi:hypothetical protein